MTPLSQGAPHPASPMACARATMRSHASIAAARRTYDCAGVRTGPSTMGTASAAPDGVGTGAAANNAERSVGSAPAPGKSPASAGEAVERSMTPRWTRIEGNTLSANTGRCDICGTGKGEGSCAPNRMATPLIRKSAFLKQ